MTEGMKEPTSVEMSQTPHQRAESEEVSCMRGETPSRR